MRWLIPTVGLFLLTWASLARSDSPGFVFRLDCGLLITGGSEFAVHYPDADRESVSLHDVKTGAVKHLLQVEDPFNDVQLSLSCRRFTYQKFNRESGEVALHIISRIGEKNRVLLDVHPYRYAWGKMGTDDCLAYITGSDSYETGFLSSGTWLLNLESGESWQVHPEGSEIAWSEFDQSFYLRHTSFAEVRTSEVLRIDPITREVEKTPYLGIDFSPGGTYYHTRLDGDAGLPIAFYRRAGNENISARYTALMLPKFGSNPTGWLDDSTLLFPADRYKHPGVKCRVIDLAEQKAWDVSEYVLGLANDGETMLVITGNEKVEKRLFNESAHRVQPAPAEGAD